MIFSLKKNTDMKVKGKVYLHQPIRDWAETSQPDQEFPNRTYDVGQHPAFFSLVLPL